MAAPSWNDMIYNILSRYESNVVITDHPKFDLESYIQNYKGRTRLERLMFIGRHSVSLCVDALKAAVVEAKNGRDVRRYAAIVQSLEQVAPHEPDATYDRDWMDRVTKENAHKTKELEDQLKSYKNNLIRDSIRMGNEDLGVHYREIGDLDKAYEAFGRMRNDMQSQKSLMDTTLRIISVAIDQERWLIVESNVQKLTVQSFSPEDELALQPYLKCASGLASLAEGKFYNAARSFLAVDSGRGQAVNEIVSANDIAVYGGLCALATMDRNDLQTKVLDNSNFRTYLELEPHIRRAIQQFVGGRYPACLSTLENYRADYLLDIYLHKHVTALYQLIRSKSIIQYFIPFSCVTLDSMDEAFGGSGRSIEKELIGMIESGALEARIDKQNRLLTSVPSLPRAALQAQTLESAENYEREMRNRILRMNILGAGLEVKPQKKAQHPLSSMSMAQGDGPNTRSRGREASPLSVEHDSGYD